MKTVQSTPSKKQMTSTRSKADLHLRGERSMYHHFDTNSLQQVYWNLQTLTLSCSKCNVTANNADVARNVRQDYNSLPYLDISSTSTNIPHLTNSDVDLHMPYDLNFNYYDTHEFHDNQDIIECFSGNNCFSALNCNIRSLSANFDNLANMLHELHFPFPLIGLTETKLKHNIPYRM